MEILRYKYIFVSLLLCLPKANNEPIPTTKNPPKESTNCPFTKIIEDIFKIHNKTSQKGVYLEDRERAKLFLDSISNVTKEHSSNQEDLVNGIIETINRIKNKVTETDDSKMNEAIILNVPNENTKNVSYRLEDGHKTDNRENVHNVTGSDKKEATNQNNTTTNNKINTGELDKTNSTEKIMYVEILTIEPNNTSANNSSNNIIEVLKHLMPMFNSTLNKELHNITIIEKNHNKNHTFSASKNISTIVVTFCDKENFTKANVTFDSKETYLKVPLNETESDYYFDNDSIMNDDRSGRPGLSDDDDNYDDMRGDNMTMGERKDILEAAEYGMQKMHELYSVLEPKLYSMGLWLEDANPARYVAAFNAPSEEATRYAKYGYATLQAAAKLKELTGGDHDGLESRAEEAQFPSASALRQSPLLQHCPLKGAPKCPPASKRYRTHDGTCNNLNRPRWGSTMTPVQRFLPPSYSDGIQAPRRSVFGTPLPSAREISSLVHEDQNVESPGITHLLMQWGQFLDHDVTSSSQSRGFNGSVPRCCKDGGRDFVPKEFMHPECLPIAVPASDPFYGPKGVRCLDFVRSSPAPRDDCALGWREQINQVSAYIDGSPLYASSARQSDKLRLFRNGMLQYGRVQQRRPLLPPERKDELCRGGAVSTDCFKSGDARVNEHPGLVAAHIVWLRQHNRMAQELAHLNPQWSDEKIYQETRKIVGAMIQHITYREFLPIVLGPDVMRLFELEPQSKGFYRGYEPKINPSPASSFGSAAFRFGHSLVQPSMVRFDRFHRPINNNVSLHDELTNPSNIWSMGAVDRLLLGMVNQPIQKRDEFITEELTNHLFQTPSFKFGMDLAAINIQRGRDHGVPPYTAWREPCGLSEIRNFEDLLRVMPLRAARKLETLYRHVDDIDLFTGGMAERPVVGGLVGPTFACIIAQQFSNLRKGDRFWYENGGFESSFTPAQLQQIRRISFAQVLCHTLDTIDSIQPFVFLSPDNPDNERISCQNGLLNDFDLSPWIELNSEFNNNIDRADENELPSTLKPVTNRPTQRPRRTKPTTTTLKPKTTTKKNQKLTSTSPNKTSQKPLTVKPTNSNKNKTNVKDEDNLSINLDKLTADRETATTNLDDKLDFKNKSRRFEDSEKPDTRVNYNRPLGNDYEDEENVQSVQSVVINNVPHKRPYNSYNKRPVITVTENVDKYTYLINYVPRPTESYRPTTRRTYDKEVVKVTYQTYDDTYRRPNKPYYYNRHTDNRNSDDRHTDNRHDHYDNDYYRRNRPSSNKDNDSLQSSARSNDDTVTTQRPKATIDKIDNTNPTTENLYKLVTFGYVGTYKGEMPVDSKVTKPDVTDKDKTISKDFSTYDSKTFDNDNDQIDTMKLSTFFHYETATRPYSNIHRPTRRNDDEILNSGPRNKYYYIKNVLHKYPDNTNDEKDRKNEHKVEEIEERSVVDKMDFLEEAEKAAEETRSNTKMKQPVSAAKTPSVAFQVIPSENAPYQWAIYDEKPDLPEGLPLQIPTIATDPQALREVPRPMLFGTSRRRRPGRS